METKKIIKMIEKDFGKSFSKIKNELKKSCQKGGCSDHLNQKEKGYSLFYTDNANFANGVANGYGKGCYIRMYFTGMCGVKKLG